MRCGEAAPYGTGGCGAAVGAGHSDRQRQTDGAQHGEVRPAGPRGRGRHCDGEGHHHRLRLRALRAAWCASLPPSSACALIAGCSTPQVCVVCGKDEGQAEEDVRRFRAAQYGLLGDCVIAAAGAALLQALCL